MKRATLIEVSSAELHQALADAETVFERAKEHWSQLNITSDSPMGVFARETIGNIEGLVEDISLLCKGGGGIHK